MTTAAKLQGIALYLVSGRCLNELELPGTWTSNKCELKALGILKCILYRLTTTEVYTIHHNLCLTENDTFI